MQNVVFELVKMQLLSANPEEFGLKIEQKYDVDQTKSGIFLDIAYNWKADVVQKRPAIFIQRAGMSMKNLTLGNSDAGGNTKESIDARAQLNTIDIQVKCIGTNVGFTEQFAEYVRQPLVQYQQEIQRDFKLNRFRVTNLSEPSIYVESKEHFVIIININAVFKEGWQVKGDHLKLKTVSRQIFDSVCAQPMANQ